MTKLFADWQKRFPDAKPAEVAVVREQYGMKPEKEEAPKTPTPTETKKD